MDFAGGVFEDYVGEDGGVGFVGQMGAEAYAYVEGLIEVEGDGRAELMHGFAFEAEEDGEVVALLFDADAFGDDGDERVGAGAAGTASARNAEFHVSHAGVLLGALGEVGHACSVEGDDGFLRVVVEALADDEEGLAVTVAVGVGEGDVGGEGDVA